MCGPLKGGCYVPLIGWRGTRVEVTRKADRTQGLACWPLIQGCAYQKEGAHVEIGLRFFKYGIRICRKNGWKGGGAGRSKDWSKGRDDREPEVHGGGHRCVQEQFLEIEVKGEKDLR